MAGFPKFRGESSLKTRVWRISLNTCNNQLRKKNRSVRTIQLSLDIDLYNNEDTKSRQIQDLHEIAKFDLFDRYVILLWLENMSNEDIANIAGISVQYKRLLNKENLVKIPLMDVMAV
jgi:RNA polymerase sigma-70 factor (ECF subfamily)